MGVRDRRVDGRDGRKDQDEAHEESQSEFQSSLFDNFMGLKLDLEDLLGLRVDLLTPKCLRPEMERAIAKEAILVP